MSDEKDLDHVDQLIAEAKQSAEHNADQLRAEPDPQADRTGRAEVHREEAEAEAHEIEADTGTGTDTDTDTAAESAEEP